MPDRNGMARFWAKVDKSQGLNGCWIWQGGTHNFGYLQFRWEGKTYGVMKLAYQSLYGATAGRFTPVCCMGNHKCCNPVHLVLGERKSCVAS